MTEVVKQYKRFRIIKTDVLIMPTYEVQHRHWLFGWHTMHFKWPGSEGQSSFLYLHQANWFYEDTLKTIQK